MEGEGSPPRPRREGGEEVHSHSSPSPRRLFHATSLDLPRYRDRRRVRETPSSDSGSDAERDFGADRVLGAAPLTRSLSHWDEEEEERDSDDSGGDDNDHVIQYYTSDGAVNNDNLFFRNNSNNNNNNNNNNYNNNNTDRDGINNYYSDHHMDDNDIHYLHETSDGEHTHSERDSDSDSEDDASVLHLLDDIIADVQRERDERERGGEGEIAIEGEEDDDEWEDWDEHDLPPNIGNFVDNDVFPPMNNNINDNNNNNAANNVNNVNNINNIAGLEVEDEEVRGEEVRFALEEMLGLRGPLHIAVRNAAAVLAYCALFLCIAVFFPLRIGRTAVHLLERSAPLSSVLLTTTTTTATTTTETLTATSLTLVHTLTHALRVFISYIYSFPCKVQSMAETERVPVSLRDLLHIFVGATSLSAMTLSLHETVLYVLYVLGERVHAFAEPVVRPLRVCALGAKMSSLLLLRVLVMPLLLGTLNLTFAAHILLPYTAEEWATFAAHNAIGALSLVWLCGISFMLCVTLSVLQLREVLHPRILAHVIKPQEGHAELVASLADESLLTHGRRMVTSLGVYVSLSLVLVCLPVWLLSLHAHTRAFFRLSLTHIAAEIQTPVELLGAHFLCLTLLEKHKDLIGHAQYNVLTQVAHRLGLTRFLLPLPMFPVTLSESEQAKLPRVSLSARDEVSYDFTHTQEIVVLQERERERDNDNDDNNEDELSVRWQCVRIGAPLRRPPPGWDARTPTIDCRWAWTGAAPGPIESQLAPRTAPSYWLLRLAVCVCVCYAMLLTITLSVLVGPLALGRFVSVRLLPQFVQHDPVCVVVALYASVKCVVFLAGLDYSSADNVRALLVRTRCYPTVLRFMFKRIATYVCVGAVVETLVCAEGVAFSQLLSRSAWDSLWTSLSASQTLSQTLSLSHTLTALSRGLVVVEACTLALSSRRFTVRVLSALGVAPSLTQWAIVASLERGQLLGLISAPSPALLEEEFARRVAECERLFADAALRIFGPATAALFGMAFVGCVVALKAATLDVSLSLFVSAVRLLSCVGVCVVVHMTVYPSLHKWWTALELAVRNERYLVGKRLVNHTPRT